MAISSMTKKLRVVILSSSFIIHGNVTVPSNMRFSDALNRFLKDIQFLAITEVDILDLSTQNTLEKRPFMLVNKDSIIGISPIE